MITPHLSQVESNLVSQTSQICQPMSSSPQCGCWLPVYLSHSTRSRLDIRVEDLAAIETLVRPVGAERNGAVVPALREKRRARATGDVTPASHVCQRQLGVASQWMLAVVTVRGLSGRLGGGRCHLRLHFQGTGSPSRMSGEPVRGTSETPAFSDRLSTV
jgi:hypothetical protein